MIVKFIGGVVASIVNTLLSGFHYAVVVLAVLYALEHFQLVGALRSLMS